ncbi:MAG: ABC transporter permease subunit [Promethearchaeota archaeon]
MNSKYVWLLVKKDFRGIVRNRDVIVPMLVVPLILVVFLPVTILLTMNSPGAAQDSADLAILIGMPLDTNPLLLGLLFLSEYMMKPMFLMIPTMVSAVVAADSFAGEKERKTIESVLVLPCSDVELVTGKILTAFIPSIGITTGCFFLFGAIVNVSAASMGLAGTVFVFGELSWYLEVFVLTPVLSFMAILVAVMVSAHARNVKAAQGYAGTLVLPVILILFLQLFSVFTLTTLNVLVISGFLAALDAALLNLAGKTLNREALVAKLK